MGLKVEAMERGEGAAREVRVVLYPPFSREAGRREVTLAFEPGMTVGGALRRLAAAVPQLAGELAPEEFDRTHLAVSGGRLLRPDAPLAAGDELLLVPPMAGG